jgi:hypothetical protein
MTTGEDSWHSYPKIYALGHAAIKDLFADDVIVQEKVDGSQFSFGIFPSEEYPDLRCRSKGAQLHIDAPEKMFTAAIETVKELAQELHPGWTYRAEYLAKPKHNALAYDRIPHRHLIIFDINTGNESYMDTDDVREEADRLDLEVVPLIHRGRVDYITSFMQRMSVLGGQFIEGVVVKNYARFGKDGKALMGKFVSEGFKEVHGKEWRDANPNQGDVVQLLIGKYRTPARWQKAVQHMREEGALEGSPRDIGNLIKRAQVDVAAECKEEIMEALWGWAGKQVLRGSTAGLPEWYKEELLKKQFEEGTDDGE